MTSRDTWGVSADCSECVLCGDRRTTSISVFEWPMLDTMQPFFIRSMWSRVTTFLLPGHSKPFPTPLTCQLTRTPLTCQLTRTPLICQLTRTPLICQLTRTPLTCQLTRTPLICQLNRTPLICQLTRTPLICVL